MSDAGGGAQKRDFSRIDLSSVAPEELRVAMRKIAGMFPDADKRKFSGPDVIRLSDLKIRTKEQSLIPFEPNEVQAFYLSLLFGGDRWRDDPTGLRGLREIILKGRQFGLSTLIMGLYFIETVQTPYTNTVIIAHDAPTTEKMFQVVHRYYKNLPPNKRPVSKYENKRELYWPELDSSFYVGQAGSVTFGAGLTINNLHCSEVPKWPDARRLMATVSESVPPHGNIVIESTAEGYGNYYQEEWSNAERGESQFSPRFFSWPMHSEYRIDPKEYAKKSLTPPKAALDYFNEGPSEEERKIKETFGLDEPQMAWMRWKRLALGAKFPQEYPLTPEEAFITTGQCYFDLNYLSMLNRAMTDSRFDPLESANIPRAFHRLRAAFVSGEAEVWAEPRPGRLYVIGADPAEGLNDDGNHDYCSADVLDAASREQVLTVTARMDPHEFGLLLAEIGFWHNVALLAVERNNHGHAVLNALVHEAGYPLMDSSMESGLYCHQEFDRITNKRSSRPGWPNLRPQKMLALDFLRRELDDKTLGINCRTTVSQMMRFNKLPGGGAGGADNSFDDKVTSLSLAAAMLNLRPSALGDYRAGGPNRVLSLDDLPRSWATAKADRESTRDPASPRAAELKRPPAFAKKSYRAPGARRELSDFRAPGGIVLPPMTGRRGR